MNISVVGLGKLGLCTAACFASKGHRVIGVEKRMDFISELRQRRCPIDEPGLVELLDKSWENFTATDDLTRAVYESQAVFIIVPTPSKPDGRFTNEYVIRVLEEIGPALAQKQEFTVIDIVSTVMPGSSENEFKPLLEDLSGKRCGTDFGLVYNPEFIALGSVVRDFLNPDMVLIGASDARSSDLIRDLYASTCDSNPYFAQLSLVNAEITKLSLNCYVTMKISYANELAAICEQVPGADVDEVTRAIGADSRVGSKYLKGGLGFGGPCFPRDNLAFQAFAADAGYEARLGPQVVAVNQAVVGRLFDRIEQSAPGRKIAILGMSYKPGTHIIEESQSVMLARELAGAGYQVRVHDPRALESVRAELGDAVVYCEQNSEAVQDADAVVLMTNWPEYKNLDWENLKSLTAPNALVVDCWRIIDTDHKDENYHAVGLGSKDGVRFTQTVTL